ncbi:MAG: adenosylmethionine--8-amino-7-oxononanoate transaminase [Nevskiaceae bacterium]|nr:MAG: adenosylmethionine--8-amino-7-oxononanoate transaminase [Nevskiaceae bacterium]TBR73950.1 MAG: adenosylmethionine--8-amino-7-oxononanoate transaminase [Nevskiaceae bacterium]
MPNNDWIAHAADHVWYPATQMKVLETEPLVPIASAQGAWLHGADGKPYLDAIGSWWTSVFGHRHPHVVARLKAQLDRLDHVMMAGFTHEPAVALAEKLCAIVPPGLTRVFYAEIGAAAVEIALKMSAHYWVNTGHPKKSRFITIENGYHGETLGALAVCGQGWYRDAYAPLFREPIFVPSPDCYNRPAGMSWEDYSRSQFRHMEAALDAHADEVAAVIVEPLVQGAGGLRMYHPVYLKLLREACTRHNVHLILDEIAVGFGRTGRMFASDWVAPCAAHDDSQQPFAPDFMCLSKGLTAGVLPLSCVMTTDAVYGAFYADPAAGKGFLHSHTFTGNPLACVAGLAALEIFEQEDWMARNRRTAQRMWEGVAPLRSHPHVSEVRQQGTILAIEMAKDPKTHTPYPASERRSARVYHHAMHGDPDLGVLLRPICDVVYFMPPYIVDDAEIDLMCRTAIAAIDYATRD